MFWVNKVAAQMPMSVVFNRRQNLVKTQELIREKSKEKIEGYKYNVHMAEYYAPAKDLLKDDYATQRKIADWIAEEVCRGDYALVIKNGKISIQ